MERSIKANYCTAFALFFVVATAAFWGYAALSTDMYSKTNTELFREKRHVTKYNGSYYFMHIPKTGGASMEVELKRITKKTDDRLVYFYPPGPFSTSQRKDLFPEDVTPRVISQFRSPAAHVISMYEHCMTSSIHAPNRKYMPSFDAWIEDFANTTNYDEAHMHSRKYHCFSPFNMQRQRMETHSPSELYAFGVLEYFDASICLVEYAITGVFPGICWCKKKSLKKLTHNDHHAQHDITVATLTDRQKQLIHIFTSEDEVLYEEAVHEFLRRVKTIEEQQNVTISLRCS